MSEIKQLKDLKELMDMGFDEALKYRLAQKGVDVSKEGSFTPEEHKIMSVTIKEVLSDLTEAKESVQN